MVAMHVWELFPDRFDLLENVFTPVFIGRMRIEPAGLVIFHTV